MDALYVAVIVVFTAAAYGFTIACDALRRDPEERS